MARLLEHGGDGCAAGHLEDSPVLAAARARKLQVLRLLLLNELVENGAEEAWAVWAVDWRPGDGVESAHR